MAAINSNTRLQQIEVFDSLLRRLEDALAQAQTDTRDAIEFETGIMPSARLEGLDTRELEVLQTLLNRDSRRMRDIVTGDREAEGLETRWFQTQAAQLTEAADV